MAAEARTSGEIVTVLAERSDEYRNVRMAVAALAALFKLFGLALFPTLSLALVQDVLGGWNIDWTPRALFALATFSASAAFAIAWLAQGWAPLGFALVPGPIKTVRVHARALSAFRIGAERRTHGRTGILVYLSMAEHRAVILADETIAGKVDPEIWGDAMAAMLAELRAGRVADGLCAAVERVGAVLAEHFPRDDADGNELPDRLIEI